MESDSQFLLFHRNALSFTQTAVVDCALRSLVGEKQSMLPAAVRPQCSVFLRPLETKLRMEFFVILPSALKKGEMGDYLGI